MKKITLEEVNAKLAAEAAERRRIYKPSKEEKYKVIEMYRYQGMSIAAISRETGRTPQTIKRWLMGL